ncbi:hypothetical protein CsSME_00051397 [Camellia sinensis var. sinensis]
MSYLDYNFKVSLEQVINVDFTDAKIALGSVATDSNQSTKPNSIVCAKCEGNVCHSTFGSNVT